ERLQNTNFTVIQHGDKKYLKLFSPTLVESPVSYLSTKQLTEDKTMWEDGPDAAFQKQLEMERREANKARSRQHLRGLVLGLFLGGLLNLLALQQAAAKVSIPGQITRHDSSPLVILMIMINCAAIFRSGTRCMMSATAACVAVLVCFVTYTMHQTRRPSDFRVYARSVPPTPSAP
ncbi:hypothetical protein BGW38_003715, partial [Lunasporangiospora selenospora]